MLIAHVSAKMHSVGGVKTIEAMIYINWENKSPFFTYSAPKGFLSSFNLYSVNMRYNHLGAARALSYEQQFLTRDAHCVCGKREYVGLNVRSRECVPTVNQRSHLRLTHKLHL